MKLTINSRILADALSVTRRALPKTASMPITENYLLVGDGENLMISGSDTALAITRSIPNTAKGMAVVSRELADIAGRLPDCDVELDAETPVCKIKWSRGKFAIPAYDASEYPMPVRGEVASRFTADRKTLENALKHTIPFVMQDDLRPQMCGINVATFNDALAFAASDSKSLATISIPRPKDIGDCSATIPSNAVQCVLDVMRGEDSVEFGFGDRNCHIKVGNTEIVTRLIEGIYPKYQSIIPKNNENVLHINKKQLLDAIARVKVCSGVSSVIKFQFSGSAYSISALDLDMSMSAEEELADCEYNGNDLQIGFSESALSNALKSINDDWVSIKIAESNRAVLLVGDTDTAIVVLMPIRL